MKNRFLITGGTGFVGSNIVRTLVKRGEKVSIIVRNKKLNWRLNDLIKGLDIYEAEIMDPSIANIINKVKPDYIFHLAAYGVMPKESDVNKMIDVNLNGTINLIEAVKKNPFKLFINTGTSVEYGVKDKKMREPDVLSPINDYGVTKAAATLYVQKEGIRTGLPIITFRLFTPFGYYEDGSRLVPSIILSAIKNKPIKVSVPTSVRDFIFIEDLVDFYLSATGVNFKPGDILNLGSGKCFTIKDMVGMILEITNSKSKVVWGGVEKQKRFIEPKRWEADMSKAKKIIKWKPKHSVKQGLEEAVKWFSKNQDLYE